MLFYIFLYWINGAYLLMFSDTYINRNYVTVRDVLLCILFWPTLAVSLFWEYLDDVVIWNRK